MVGFHAMNYLVSGDEPTRFGNNSRDTVPTAALETADGPIFVACANDRTWQRMAGVLGRPDLAAHPDYARTRERTRNREPLMAIIECNLLTSGRVHWLEKMRDAGVPAGAINTVAEAFGSPEIAARELVTLSRIRPRDNSQHPPAVKAARHATGRPGRGPGLSQHAGEICATSLATTRCTWTNLWPVARC